MGKPRSAIQLVIRQAVAEGNSVQGVSAGWTEVRRVTHMAEDISDALWEELRRSQTTLRSWVSEGSPHNPAERGFTDDAASWSVSFPIGRS